VLKKTITYEDFNGETVSEDFFFHLSKAELVELEMSHTGGLSASLERIIAAQDNKALIAEFKNLILSSYGKRSDDGRRFIKNQELRNEFESSAAYDALFMELVTDTDAAIDFVQGMIPPGIEELAEQQAQRQAEKPALTPVKEPEEETIKEIVSKKMVAAMNQDELENLGARLAKGEVVLGE
jgi:hypothetical protein